MQPTTRLLLTLLVFSLAGASPSMAQQAAAPGRETSAVTDNSELKRLHEEDQADRKPPPGKSIDWDVDRPRDDARLARVKELYASGALHTGPDYFHAALILQHSAASDDYLLAHDLCVVALIKGGAPPAKWLAAASLDRFLRSINRPQHFGTQYSSKPGENEFHLDPVDNVMNDALRQEFAVPTLEQAKVREAEMNRK
jgi:hypothetical protein